MNELKGILHYIYLLQSSIEYCSQMNRFPSDIIVYRGLKSGGGKLIPLYHSMVGEKIVWSSFTSTSTNRDYVIENFITGEDSILFEIVLHPGDIAACIEDYSRFDYESEVLIAASSGFMIESVDISMESEGNVKQFTIPLVKLSYQMSWSDFDIDEYPPTILLESECVIKEESLISLSTAMASHLIDSWTILNSECKDKQSL
jgi:hypothetical protein